MFSYENTLKWVGIDIGALVYVALSRCGKVIGVLTQLEQLWPLFRTAW